MEVGVLTEVEHSLGRITQRWTDLQPISPDGLQNRLFMPNWHDAR